MYTTDSSEIGRYSYARMVNLAFAIVHACVAHQIQSNPTPILSGLSNPLSANVLQSLFSRDLF